MVRVFRPLRCGLLCLMLAFLGCSQAYAQPDATLRVVVTDAADGGTLQGANVILNAAQSDRRYAGATNVDGFLEISRIVPGTYTLTISFVGFETQRDTLALQAEERRTVRASLAIQEQALGEVEVQAERGAARREAGLQAATAADIERIPVPGATGDLASYLQTLPGVVSVGDRGGQLFIRGGTPSQNLIRVDGLPIIQPFHISSLYSAFPQDIVRNADIYAGGFSAEYMGAVSSVIDVTLRRGNMKRYVGSASVSPFLATARVEGPIKTDEQSFLFVARRSLVDDVDDAIYSREVPLRFYDLTGRYSLQTDNASCNITGMYTSDEGRLNNNLNASLAWSNLTVGGRCLVFGSRIDHALDLRAGLTTFENSVGTADNPERSANLRKVYFGIHREQDISNDTRLKLGARWELAQYEATLDEQFVTLEEVRQNGVALQAYASMKWSPGEKVTVSPSVGTHLTDRRIDRPTLEPRLRLTYRPDGTDQQEISFAAGLYNQVAEGITDRRDAGTVFTVWKFASEEGDVLKARHAILGYQQRIGKAVEASVEGYVKDLSNIPVPQWTPEARFNTRTALADGLAYGFDARVEWAQGPFYSFVGYGWSSIEYDAARDDLGAWIEGSVFSYSPAHNRTHQVNAVASYEWLGVTTSASWQFGSGRPYTRVFGFDLTLDLPEDNPATAPGTALTLFDRPYGAELPAYHRLDVSVERAFSLSSRVELETKLGAINTYDRSNIFYFDVNQLQRVNQSPVLPYLSLRVLVE